MYSGSLITELKSTLTKAESPPETPVEQKSKCALCLLLPLDASLSCSFIHCLLWCGCLAAPVESKADLRSTIVAEFVVSIK